MAGYTGQFECKVDAKGRMKLPAGLLRQVPEQTRTQYVINKGFDNCLILYPQAAWEQLTEKLNKLNYFNTKHRDFLRAFYRNSVMVELDSSERVLIPKRLAETVGIDDEIVILAYGNNIELWSKARFDAIPEPTSEDIAQLANDVLGGINLFE
jgi:MraZ protein